MNYRQNKYYNEAQEYLKSHDLNGLPLGTHVIEEGRLWVNIVETNLKAAGDAVLEAHDEYIDIQIPLSGPESYGVKPRSSCIAPRGEMDKAKDILFFDDKPDSFITAQPGEQTVFEPDTAHAPLVGEGLIRKAIFKVKVV